MTLDLFASALTSAEIHEGALQRVPAQWRSMESAALENSGGVILWNGRGDPVEVSPEDAFALAVLLIRRRMSLTWEHAFTLARAAHAAGDPAEQERLSQVLYVLTRYLPPHKTLPLGQSAVEVPAEVKAYLDAAERTHLDPLPGRRGLWHLAADGGPEVRVSDPIEVQMDAFQDFRLVSCDDAAAELYDYPYGELLRGARLRDFFPPEPENLAAVRQLLENGHMCSGLTTLTRDPLGWTRIATHCALGQVRHGRLEEVWGVVKWSRESGE